MTTAVASIRYRFGHFELLPGERRLLAAGAAAHLGPHAFDLLVVLVERSGKLVTKDELLARLWPRVVVEENTLQVHVSALRKVLGADAIATISGQGYRFVLEVTREVMHEAAHEVAPAALPTRRHNLPHQLTSFVGRDLQIDQVRRLLTGTRLLTLTGTGGCGKTRLALQVAGEIVDRYAEGVWLVELAPLADPTLVPQAVANALAIKEQAGKELTYTVAEWVDSRQMLLVLDNAEHLLGACAQFADALLRRCQHLVLLVTSRERLGVVGELTYRVPSLSLPDPRQETTSVEVLACEAARLFIERARLQRPDFDVTSSDAAALNSICRRLDGIALAIELAAPRVRHMSMEELSRQLDDRFGVLTGGSRTALPRHRTLRALIDWSYDLLDDAERTVLQRASVFAGGCTLEAAERVCCGGNIESRGMLDLLTSLADKSLVLAETQDGETRFGMLETMRHYAQARLRDSNDDVAIRTRHVECVLEMAEELDAAPDDAGRQRMLIRLDKDLDNVRAALEWCAVSASRAITGLRIAGRLHWLWFTRGWNNEGRGWLARLLAVAPTAARGEAHALALHAAGALAYGQGAFSVADAHHREALGIWRELGDRRQMARSIGNLGHIAIKLGDHQSARARYEQALAIAREIGDRRSVAMGLYCLGWVALEAGGLSDAQAVLEESVAISREIGSWSASLPLSVLGAIRHRQGDCAAARSLWTECLEGYRALGDRDRGAQALVSLAWLSHDEGDVETAASLLREALLIQQGIGAPMSFTLEIAGWIALARAEHIAATRLLGAAQGLRDHTGDRPDLQEREHHQRHLDAARRALNDDVAFDLAWNEGRSWTLDQVVRYAAEQLV